MKRISATIKQAAQHSANLLTLSRLLLTMIFFIYYWMQHSQYLGWLCFCIAALTDYLDGKVARYFNQISHFGEILDPIADKCLVGSGLIIIIMLYPSNQVLICACMLTLMREAFITGMRFYQKRSNIHHISPVSSYGKWKATLQFSSLILLLYPFQNLWREQIGTLLFLIATGVGLQSAHQYFTTYLTSVKKLG